MKRTLRLWGALLLLAAVAGCSTVKPWANTPLDPDRKAPEGLLVEGRDPTILVAVTLSGGGARAAAFGFGVLSELRKVEYTWQGKPSNLLEAADVVALEANYDYNMLMTGPYPYYLKTRIASQRGHLCNEENAATLVRLLENGCERFALCHISQENNTPELALESVRAALLGAGIVPGRDCVVNAARRHEVSPIIEF